ncbi:MAG: hypothetical protein KKB50_03390, partial [Planctomycetes bacterium]|nr:hypothetical protein [Planctomycetota bacterium]
IVFSGRLGANEHSDEIFLYEDGELIPLTDDAVRDGFPDINDDGTIVWSRGIGPDGPYGPTLEIVMWQDGELTRLTDDDVSDYGPEINNLGHIVWSSPSYAVQKNRERFSESQRRSWGVSAADRCETRCSEDLPP